MGTAGVMREGDTLVGHHRSHGHLIARGADLRRMMAEMFGRRTGYCKGLGGSMHIADLSLDILGCNGIVGAGLPHACGAGLTAKLRGTGSATVAFFGDGAAGPGRRARVDEPRRDVEAPGRLHLREQPVRAHGRLAHAARGRRHRRARRGLRDARRDRRRQRPGRRRGRRRARAGVGPRRRGPDAARDEDVPPDAALDAREPAGRARPGRDRRVGAEGSAAAARAPARRARRARRRRRRARSRPRSRPRWRPRSRRRSPTSPRAPDDLLPSVFAPHRAHPEPPAPGERALGFVAAIREALDQELAADARRDRDGRGRRPRRRASSARPRASTRLRRRADPRHAADRERLRRLRRSAPR